MASLPLLLKVIFSLLLVALCRGEGLEESGQYSPELYEKPYETTEAAEEVTTEVAETESPEVSEEPEETPEAADSGEYTPEATPGVPVAPGAPVFQAAPGGPLAPASLTALPYPLLYSAQYAAPLVYSTPHYLRVAAGFPTVIV